MADADGVIVSDKRVCVHFSDAETARADELITKLQAGTAAAADIAGSGLVVDGTTNRLMNVTDITEYGSTVSATTEPVFCDTPIGIEGSQTLSHPSITIAIDHSNALHKKFLTLADSTAVALAVEFKGDTDANISYDVIVGVIGGRARVLATGTSQKVRRTITIQHSQFGIPTA